MDARQDSLVRWAAQGRPEAAPLWSAEGCVVVATGVYERDRIVVAGRAETVWPVVAQVWERRPDHAVLGEADIVRDLSGAYTRPGPGWMDLGPADPSPTLDTRGIGPVTDAEVAAVLAEANPHAWVRAGDPSVECWVGGTSTVDGRPLTVAVGALAWSSPDVGFVAGVGTLPRHRGQGWSGRVCAVLRDRARAERGSVALMVESDNAAAFAVYRRLGFRHRLLWVARRSSPSAADLVARRRHLPPVDPRALRGDVDTGFDVEL